MKKLGILAVAITILIVGGSGLLSANAAYLWMISCDVAGTQKEVFIVGETIYVNATGLPPNAMNLPIHVVVDVLTWFPGMAIPPRVAGSVLTINTDALGTISPSPTAVWPNAQLGTYDIIIDVNRNAVYDLGIDVLDNDDVVATAGFFVIPEYLLGGLLALAACFAAFVVFKKQKSNHT